MTLKIQPLTFKQFCDKMRTRVGKRFYVVMNGKVLTYRLAAFQPSWSLPTGITYNYRRPVFSVFMYANEDDFSNGAFCSFTDKQTAKAYLGQLAEEHTRSASR